MNRGSFIFKGGNSLLSVMVIVMLAVSAVAVISTSNENAGAVPGDAADFAWAKNHGGNLDDQFNLIIEISDGFIAVGNSWSTTAGFTSKGNGDGIIVKLDLDGNMVWINNFGGSGNDYFSGVIEISDGFIAIGSSNSTNAGFTNKGNFDGTIVKFDLDGNMVWAKNHGGNLNEFFNSIVMVSDGFFVAGYSLSTNFGFNSFGQIDAFVAKFDFNGDMEWIKNYGGAGDDYFFSIAAVADGIIAAGESNSTNNGINNIGGSDAILVKFDFAGEKIWAKNYGGAGNDYFSSVTTVADGIIAVGNSYSTTEDITNHGAADAILVKFDLAGKKIWATNYGGNDYDSFNSVTAVANGFIAVGASASTNMEDFEGDGTWDSIIVKFDRAGEKVWAKSYGGNGQYERFMSVLKVSDGVIAVGTSPSTNAGFDNRGEGDAIVVKYDLSYTLDLAIDPAESGIIELTVGDGTEPLELPFGQYFKAGTEVTVTAVDDGQWKFSHWIVNADTPADFDTQAASNTFSIDSVYDFTAVFYVPAETSTKNYYITASSDPKCIISPSGTVTVPAFATKTFTFSAEKGYAVSSVEVDGVQLSQSEVAKGSYTFVDVKANHTIKVTNRAVKSNIPLTIDIDSGKGYAQYSTDGGNTFQKYIGPVNLAEFCNLVIVAYADNGYTFEKWVSGNETLTTEEVSYDSVTAPVSLKLSFEKEDGSFPWLILLIVLFVILLLVVLFVLLRRKKV